MASAARLELDLRLRAEELVALAAFGPVAEVMAELDGLEAAAAALEASGLLPSDRSIAIVGEVVDALVVRGATWLAPVVPDLDVARLYDVAAGGRQPLLRRVVPVVATIGAGTVTTVELWSDRAAARVVGRDGTILPSHVVGAAGVDDRRLELRDPSGAAIGVDLTSGRIAREAPGVVEPSSVERHLDAVVTQAIGDVRRDPSIDQLNRSRARVTAAAQAIAPDRAEASAQRFDRVVEGLHQSPVAPFLLEVVPVAQRFFGGWLLSIETWSDHWRAVILEEDPVARRWWTAVDDRGDGYGGASIDVDVVRFDGALPMAWRTLRLQRHHGPDVLAVEVER